MGYAQLLLVLRFPAALLTQSVSRAVWFPERFDSYPAHQLQNCLSIDQRFDPPEGGALAIQFASRSAWVWIVGFTAQVALAIALVLKHQWDDVA